MLLAIIGYIISMVTGSEVGLCAVGAIQSAVQYWRQWHAMKILSECELLK